jgi:hypothetical protein
MGDFHLISSSFTLSTPKRCADAKCLALIMENVYSSLAFGWFTSFAEDKFHYSKKQTMENVDSSLASEAI